MLGGRGFWVVPVVLAVTVLAPTGAGAAQGVRAPGVHADGATATTVPGTSCPAFPADNVWNTNISGLPVDPDSATWLAAMDASSTNLHPDFGPSGDPAVPYGIPYTVVSPSQPLVHVAFQYADQSDPGPYPFGPATPIEGGPAGGGDRHALMVNPATCTLYELWDAHYRPTGDTAGSGAMWSLSSDALRPAGWTSADAAGLPVLPGLVDYDQAASGVMDHAIRVTAQCTQQSYLWPARHEAGQADADCPPMGARFRLDASFTLPASSCDELCQTVVTTMKTYGLIVADNGSNWFFQGTADPRWSLTDVNQLKQIPAADFQAVDESCLMESPDSGAALQPGTSPYDAACPDVTEFTSDATATAVAGSAFSDQVTTASPAPATVTESGALPAGVTFTADGDGTATFGGTPAPGSAGDYPLTLTADDGTDSPAVQEFQLVVAAPPTVTGISPASGGTGGGTSVTITGSSFTAVTGVSVGGTAVTDYAVTSPTTIVADTPPGPAGPADVTVTTAGGQGAAAGAFTYLSAGCSPPAVTSAASASAAAGTAFSFTVTTCSAAVPSIKAVGLPSGLHLTADGGGTATIAGTPSTTASGGVYQVVLEVSAPDEGANQQTWLLAVSHAPAFHSKATALAHTGTPLDVAVTTTLGYPAPSLTTTSPLPAGVSLVDNGNGTAALSGTPGPAAGGVYPLSLVADNGVGPPVTQSFTLTVDQAPAFTSTASDTVTAHAAMAPFPVTTTGYPAAKLTAAGLPAGLHLVAGAAGTASIEGTPTVARTYAVTLKATSKAGTVTQAFSLTVTA